MEKLNQKDINDENKNQIVIDKDKLSDCEEKIIEIEVLNSEMKNTIIMEKKMKKIKIISMKKW